MSKYKAILEELVGTAYNIPGGELSELLKKPDEELSDEDVQQLADTFKTRHRNVISSINITNNKALDEKFKAGERKKAQEFEKSLKEVFGVDSDKQGHELIEEIVSVHNAKPENKGKQLTDDDIKKHPAFIRAESEYKKQLKEAQEVAEKSVNDLKADYQRKEVIGKVSKAALDKFNELNPVLSDDAKRAAAQRDLFLEKIAGYDYEEVDGKFVPLKEGKRIENEFGHALEFDDLVKNTTTSYFDIRVAEERKAPHGAQPPVNGQQSQTKYTGKMPKTDAEWRQMQEDPNIPLKDKMAINDAWAKSQVPA